MASSSSSSSCSQRKYDVFLSFRGEDTRNNFTSHLFAAFCREKIKTFIDEQLKKGDDISSALLNAIEESKISVIIFSKGYASSKWCLDELIKILECKKRNGQIVIPVFYNVDPSDVRNQTGSFGDAFVKHENDFKDMPQKVLKWKAALTQASNLSGWDSMKIRHEAELVDEIVKDILKKIHDISHLGDSEDLVGLDSLVQRIQSPLCIGLTDFRMVRIRGMGGIAKTTIAGAIFKQISSEFEGRCFKTNVTEESKGGALVHVRQQILSQILGENIKIETPVLPQYIKKMLQQYLKVCIRQNHCPEDLLLLSYNVDVYANGSPLALKELGWSFYRKSQQDWENAWHYLKQISDPDIHGVLKIGYDELNYKVKDLFLDNAYFFNGEDRYYVKIILSNRYLVHYGLNILADKALITISNNKLQIHDSLQVTDQRIICHESYKDPGKCSSWLWYHEDVYHVLKKNKGTDTIEGMSLDMSKETFKLKWIELHCSKDLAGNPYSSKMPNLERINLLNCIKFPYIVPTIHNFNHLSSLCLEGCKSLMCFSSNTYVRSPIAVKFSSCVNLTEFPKELYLRGTPIEEIPSSVECLTMVENLNLENCKKLKSINISKKSICKRAYKTAINSVYIFWLCNVLCVSSLQSLDLRGNYCKSLPQRIEQLSQLRSLYFSNCITLQSLQGLSFSLSYLKAKNCKQLQYALPKLPTCLQELDASEGFQHVRGFSLHRVDFVFINGLKLNQDNPLADSQLGIQHTATVALRIFSKENTGPTFGFTTLCVAIECEEPLGDGLDYLRVNCSYNNFETETPCESENILKGFAI